mmetsp:Transcript_56841/g.133521  ORF Transcript_56841/g.133521 Transcript_56841/m.133521 type:complete len:257 (-) Transcript_56841:687-1457(-)
MHVSPISCRHLCTRGSSHNMAEYLSGWTEPCSPGPNFAFRSGKPRADRGAPPSRPAGSATAAARLLRTGGLAPPSLPRFQKGSPCGCCAAICLNFASIALCCCIDWPSDICLTRENTGDLDRVVLRTGRLSATRFRDLWWVVLVLHAFERHRDLSLFSMALFFDNERLLRTALELELALELDLFCFRFSALVCCALLLAAPFSSLSQPCLRRGSGDESTQRAAWSRDLLLAAASLPSRASWACSLLFSTPFLTRAI